ncbi:MAG: DUF308 domain-containing protein [Bacilli bacterium]|nr:DUF308 domain-containing protein [Bacilli bacterium]
MLEKSIKASYLLITTIFLITMGILLITMNIKFVDLLIRIICYGLILRGLINLLLLIHNKQNRNKKFIMRDVADILFGVIIISIRDNFIILLPVIFGLYFLAIAIIRTVDYYIYQKNKIKGRLGILFSIILNLLASIILTINPHLKTKYIVIIIGIYLILLGIKYAVDFLIEVLPSKILNKFKRGIKIPIPEIFTAFIPQQLVRLVNEMLEVNPEASDYNYQKSDCETDLQIIIHLSPFGTAAMGHIEIAFKNIVYSYGNYDMHSRSLFKSIGDGVILIANKQRYMKYCVEKRDRYLIDFGIKLNDKEKGIIEKNINELINTNTIDYYSDAQLIEQGKLPSRQLTDMSSEIYMYAGGYFKKITKGKYKKFFVLNNNCAMMVKSVLKVIGKDVIAINGILTPGAYYDYLNRQFMLKNTNVITRKIYTKNDFKNVE